MKRNLDIGTGSDVVQRVSLPGEHFHSSLYCTSCDSPQINNSINFKQFLTTGTPGPRHFMKQSRLSRKVDEKELHDDQV